MIEVRITRKEFPLQDVFEKGIFFLEGDGEKTKFHIQGICYDEIKLPALRARLRKYNLKGNEDYKLGQVKSEEAYLAYISKEENLILNTTSINIQDYYGKYVSQKKENKMEKIFKGVNPDDSTFSLISHVIDYYINNDLMINPRLIEGYVLTYKARSSRHFREKLIQKMTDNLIDRY